MTNQLETARQHLLSGRLIDAEKICVEILETEPESPNALYFLGLIALNLGHHLPAIDFLQKAASLCPDHPHYHYNLGLAWQRSGKPDEAIRSYETAIALKADFFEALDNLGVLYQFNRLPEKAIPLHHKALLLKPHHSGALNNLGLAFQECGELDKAVSCYLEILAIQPDHVEALNNLGFALQEKGNPGEAIACYRKALALKPDYAKAKWNLSLVLLLLGNYAEGFSLYENRFSGATEMSACKTRLDQLAGIPLWQGESLHGKSILAWAEQGLGDSLMMLRYLPLIGGKLVVLCAPEILRIVETISEVSQAIDKQGALQPESYDYHCPMMSLPRVFETRLETIPAFTLSVPGELQNKWRNRLLTMPGLRIGFAWAGGGALRRDFLRSMPLEVMIPLFRISQATFFSLQKGSASTQISNFPIINWMDECIDLMDTAALIANLDLVISVDTSVAHLAGVMGKPVWLLNRFESEWRWQLNREDSPWYPGMRIFRQTAPGDWKGVIAGVAKQLEIMKPLLSTIPANPGIFRISG